MSPAGRGRLTAAIRMGIVPLALLLAAWGASLTGIGPLHTLVDQGAESLPDGSRVPARAVEAPASVSLRPAAARAAGRDTASIITTASASGIPAAALAAYQRAGAVINTADPTCRLPWQLIAAIGRVESDHGRFGANSLDEDGIAQPGIFGIALNGKNNTAQIADTDAGQYDSDTRHDRAVGPMQFIPSTWSIIGVDGDNDGKRNPQDIDDASLAAAVYLCSGDDDLSTTRGQRASIYRYNHSYDYVDLVVAVMAAYQAGDFTSSPSTALSARAFVPSQAGPIRVPALTGGRAGGIRDAASASGSGSGSGSGGGADTAVVKGGGRGNGTPTRATPSKTPTQTTTQQQPDPSTPDVTDAGPLKTPTQAPTPTPDPAQPPTLPTVSVTPLGQTLTIALAQAQCLTTGVSGGDQAALNACIRDLMAP